MRIHLDPRQRSGQSVLLAAAMCALLWLAWSPAKPVEQRGGSETSPALLSPMDTPAEQLPADTSEIAELNALLPMSPEQIVAAKPFQIAFNGSEGLARLSAIDCLSAAIYYEAAQEPIAGQRAVAQVVLNRVRHPAFPNTVCGVVFQGSERNTGCQFTFTCDGSLRRTPSSEGWRRAQSIAAAALAGSVEPSVGHATHYHAVYVQPYWAKTLTKLNVIDSHIFYQWAGGSGRPNAFSDRYGGSEIMPLSAVMALTGRSTAGTLPKIDYADLPTDELTIGQSERFASTPFGEAPVGRGRSSGIATPKGSGIAEPGSQLAVTSGRLSDQPKTSRLIDEPRALLK